LLFIISSFHQAIGVKGFLLRYLLRKRQTQKNAPLWGTKILLFIFFYPDFTVGTGFSPVHARILLVGFTTGMEFHQSPKIHRLAAFIKLHRVGT